ncbi:lipid-transfer protein [Alcaligenaceae bacterium]|nr:lipid-transfer protein [Alcaligenaceae bacterium]
MSRASYVVGVGMTPFSKPSQNQPYNEMGKHAINAALKDAGLDYTHIQEAYAGYVYGDSTSGQAVLYEVGLTGIPIFNVNNNCATGSSALFLARRAIETGAAECVLAVGFEQMSAGALKSVYSDRVNPLQRFVDATDSIQGFENGVPRAAQLFGGAGRAYKAKYGLAPETLAKLSVKSRRHAVNNPYAVFKEQLTEEQVLASPMIFDPITRLQCCPPTSGAAAAIVCSEDFAKKHNLQNGVLIAAQAMTTDTDSAFTGDMRDVVGYGMSRSAAQQVYEAAGIGPEDVNVVELHDCFTANEFISYEALSLTPEGTAEKFIIDGDNTYGGRVVVNPSGGLLSKGHPLGATGLAQCAELVWQLRGQAENRQVDNCRVALQHNIGIGGACVVTMYKQVQP